MALIPFQRWILGRGDRACPEGLVLGIVSEMDWNFPRFSLEMSGYPAPRAGTPAFGIQVDFKNLNLKDREGIWSALLAEAERRCFGRYLRTVESEIGMPSLARSVWMRRLPQLGLACHIR